MPTKYITGIDTWNHGDRMSGPDLHHVYLGPCPECANRTFDYGGGWRCLALYCTNSTENPAGSVGPRPTWWNTDIQVTRDGDMWCAVDGGFVNLAESPAGFGKTPRKAVEALASEFRKTT